MTCLVTGSSGFIGSHLVDHLLARGDSVIVLQRRPGAARAGLTVVQGDVLDAELLLDLMCRYAPREVYHLAAQSLPGTSWLQPWPTHEINVNGTLNVLAAARALDEKPVVVVASSSSIYAQSPEGASLRETAPCVPASPYGISKLAADHLARLHADRYGMPVVRARPFFLIGPRKTGDVSSDWARNIVDIERGRAKELAVGNLEAVRDFLHVADGVAALAAIAAKGVAGEAYNIASGAGWKLTDLLQTLLAMARVRIEVRVDPARMRAVDERVKVGDAAKLRALGWRPRHSVEEALSDILQYWREQT